MDTPLNARTVGQVEGAGFHVMANEPWSGKDGLAYSPVRHAKAYGRCALEIEARQDLIVQENAILARRRCAAR